ncbi:sulfur reduction protein DsrS [Thiorhodococcus fuscus]|uniref:Sulfur reduction protein DsrS n=1 Tax=Thiorhodococcus fuscus TaxID=527200 RepID=A0ABW4Y2Z2_9GAMM
MELSHEDSLRLNVLLASKPLAIRIDTSKLRVLGLTERGELSLQLNPTTRPEQYLRWVRETISGHVLGSPGGYPVYLSRWTRMGQMRDGSLEQLLMLGEPEAVVAAVCAPGLDDELARRAWWAMEDAANARRMLTNPQVVRGRMGPLLADYLVEHLPFETDHEDIMESVQLVLQSGLLDDSRIVELWHRSARKPAYLVGFMRALPDALCVSSPARACPDVLHRLAESDPVAALIQWLYASSGQFLVSTAASALAKPPTQEVILAAFACLRDFLAPVRPEGDPDRDIAELIADADAFVDPADPDPSVAEILAELPALAPEIAAMRLLSGVGYGLLRPILSDSATLGSLMRRKLSPVLDPIQERLTLLQR